MHSETDLSDIWDNVLPSKYAQLSQITRDDRVKDGKQILSFTEKGKVYAYERHSDGGAWKPVADSPAKTEI
jgi:hypothetical protein